MAKKLLLMNILKNYQGYNSMFLCGKKEHK